MAVADDKLIEDAVLDFAQRLHAELPLRHFGEFHDPEQLTKVVKVQKRNVFAKVFDKIWPRDKEEIVALLTKLNHRMNKEVITEWARKNREHEVQSVSFLQKWVDMLCENFNEALEYEQLLNPDMEPQSLKNYIEGKKQIMTNVLENIWKPGTCQMQQERKSKLEKHLKAKEEEMLEKQKHNLESKSVEEGNKFLGEVRRIILERSRQLKCYLDKHQGRASNDILKGMVEEMLEYLLNGKGSSLRETHEENYGKLVEVLEDEVKSLSEDPERKMTAKEAERFDEQLRSYCFDTEGGSDEAEEIEEQEPQRRIILQEILNEFKEERLSEPEDRAHEEANSYHGNDGIHVDNDEVNDGRSAATTKRISRRLPFPKGRDSSSNEVPLSRTAAVAEKNGGSLHHGESTRLKKSRKSVQVASSAGRSKTSGVDSSMTSANDDKGILHPIFEEEGDDIQIRNVGVLESASPNQSDKRKQNKRKDSDEVENSSPKRKKPREDVSKTTRSAGDKCPTRRSARSRKPSKKAGAVIMSEDFGENGDDEREPPPSSPDRVQPSSSKKMKKRCPNKITFLQGDPPKYQCNVCKKKFRVLKDAYMLKYHGDFCKEKKRPFVCPECGRGFVGAQELTWHSSVHTGEKLLKCPKCPIEFKRHGDLTRHLRIHTGERPYKCTKCPMSFRNHCNLKVHLRAHDRGTSYACETCNVNFVSSKALHDHNLTHEGKLPIACNYCKMSFANIYLLKKHIVAHSGERPFQCPTCAVSHTRKFNLVGHLVSFHGQTRKVAIKLANDAALEYLLKETGNPSCRDVPPSKLNYVVLNHVIKKANLLLPDDITVATAGSKGKKE